MQYLEVLNGNDEKILLTLKRANHFGNEYRVNSMASNGI